jgi:hypothetical protein
MNLEKISMVGFIVLILCGSVLGGVSAGKHWDTYLTVHVGETIKRWYTRLYWHKS